MKVRYHFTNINKKGMAYGIGDLLKYYADISVSVREKMEMLKKQSRARDVLVNYLRKQTGSVGITVDSVFSAAERAIDRGDMFYFTVDNNKICNLIPSEDETDIEVFMDDNYFLTQMMVSKYTPSFGGFRKSFSEGVKGEKERWMEWFEKEWKKPIKFKGFGNSKFEKEILEE